jgi:hypothetical protein
MGRRTLGIGIALLLSAAPAAAADKWLHVHVVEDGGEGDTVRVNVPLSMIESMLPLVKAEGLEDGRLRLRSHDIEGVDLHAMWKALRETGDADFVTVDGTEGQVRVSRSGRYLLATVDGRERGRGENVKIRVPIAVVDALFSGPGDEIDLVAAVRALGDHGDGEIVRVENGDSRVRVWVDADQDGR